MEWKNEFSVGVPEIDKEHAILVGCVTDIEEALERNEPWYMVHSALGRLVFFLRGHFSIEESLMRALDYGDTAAHTKEHQDFLAHAESVESRTLRASVSAEDTESLRQWLEKHFIFDDTRYGDFVKERQGQESANAAYRDCE